MTFHFRRPPQGPASRAGRAARSGRCRVRAARPGRSRADRPPRRGARQIPRHRRRQEPAGRHQARGQYPPHRGEEGQHSPTPARPMPHCSSRPRKRNLPAPSALPRPRPTTAVAKEDFAAAMTAMAKLRPHVDAFFDKVTVNVEDKALAGQPAEAAERNPRSHPGGGGFLEDRGQLSSSCPACAGHPRLGI